MAQREPGGTGDSTINRWAALSRTAAAVRAESSSERDLPAPWWRRHSGAIAAAGVLATALTLAVIQIGGATLGAQADSGLDSQLFSLTNQDRASNGVRALSYNGTLQNVGEGGAYNCSGITVHGRSVDMIQRNYFSHVIPVCNQYVFPMMVAFGIHYRSAGENIGWETGGGAAYINQSFMNSPDHRANILNANYNYMGVGSAYGSGWTGNGSPTSVWMFSEEFAQLGSSPPPPPRPTPRPSTSNPPRNSSAPAGPAQPPASTQPPTPAPTPTPTPTPTPIPLGLLPVSAYPPPVFQSGGLLPDSIESVLEAFLIA